MTPPADQNHLPEGAARCLHLVAGAGRDAFDDCMSLVAPGDAVVFLDAGVLQLLRCPAGLPESPAALYFAAADLRAHGLLEAALRERARLLDDGEVCDLLAACDHCLTWR